MPGCQKLQMTASPGLAHDACCCIHMATVGVKGLIKIALLVRRTAGQISGMNGSWRHPGDLDKNCRLIYVGHIGIYTVFRKKTPTHIFFHICMSDV